METRKSRKLGRLATDIVVENSQCPMCDGFWSESSPGEDWVQCSECKNWLHEECCCSITPTNVKCIVFLCRRCMILIKNDKININKIKNNKNIKDKILIELLCINLLIYFFERSRRAFARNVEFLLNF
jgi:hypothetical protein